MSWNDWEEVAELAKGRFVPIPAPFLHLVAINILADNSHWLIGPYNELTDFATALRSRQDFRAVLVDERIRLGFRETDLPPAGLDRQKRYGDFVRGLEHDRDFTTNRVRVLAEPVRSDSAQPTNRIRDRKANVQRFWETQTPQSHHIVEFNHLKELGVSDENGENALDHAQLPAVLLAAEFHQRYVSSYLKKTHGWSSQTMKKELSVVYRSIYMEQSELFHPLWDVSRIILTKAGIKTIGGPKGRS